MPASRPRLLYVDAERGRCAAMRDLIEGGGGWETVVAGRDDEARSLLRQHSFDVVLADLDAPGIDGAAVLAASRDVQPTAVRIALIGEPDRALRALPMAHQWLGKPLAADELGEALERALRSRSFVHRRDLRQMLGAATAMPSVPRLYDQVMRALGDPDVELEGVADAIERDPAMAARVLQLANSAFHGAVRPLVSVRDAVRRLGLTTIANLVLAAGIFVRLHVEGRAAAALAVQIERRATAMSRLLVRWFAADHGERDLLAAAGLLHELGNVVLLEFDAPAQLRAFATAEREGGSLQEAQLEEFGADHAQVGASVLAAWGLPLDLVDVIAGHHDPDRRTSPVDRCAALHAAEAMVGEPWRMAELGAAAERAGWGPQLRRWFAIHSAS